MARSGRAGRRQELDTSTNYRAKYDVEKLTLSPAPGDARKEILFTRKGDTLYAILPLYPAGTLTVRNVRVAKGGRVSPARYATYEYRVAAARR